MIHLEKISLYNYSFSPLNALTTLILKIQEQRLLYTHIHRPQQMQANASFFSLLSFHGMTSFKQPHLCPPLPVRSPWLLHPLLSLQRHLICPIELSCSLGCKSFSIWDKVAPLPQQDRRCNQSSLHEEWSAILKQGRKHEFQVKYPKRQGHQERQPQIEHQQTHKATRIFLFVSTKVF